MRGILSRISTTDPSRPVDEVRSIIGNLRVLLNTRVGNASACPDFGVIDFVDLVHEFPGAAAVLQRSIRDTISEYEPRLKNVRVRVVPSDDPLQLSFEISARLASDPRRGLVRVRTAVSEGGRFQVD
jgi:type VI secretion system protein